MKYFKIVIILLISCLRTYSQFEPGLIISSSPDNNSVVTMNYKTHQLSWINIENDIRRDFTTTDVSAEKYANISVLNDSLVLISGKYIYNYKFGERTKSFSGSIFTNPSGKRLFELTGNIIREIDINGNTKGKEIKLTHTYGNPIHNLIRINEGGEFLAITFPDKKNNVVVFDLKSGNQIQLFDDFREIHFLDISPDGNQLVIGNNKSAKLYNVKTGKEIGAFEEISKNNRKNFMQASFRSDGKAVYISSWYKLYTLNTTNFEAEENIVVSNNIKVTQWNDKYGLTHKEKIVITTDYYWDSYTVFPDLKYIVGIAKHKKEDNYILYYMFLGEGGVGNKNFVL